MWRFQKRFLQGVKYLRTLLLGQKAVRLGLLVTYLYCLYRDYDSTGFAPTETPIESANKPISLHNKTSSSSTYFGSGPGTVDSYKEHWKGAHKQAHPRFEVSLFSSRPRVSEANRLPTFKRPEIHDVNYGVTER